ncbi:MAG: DUF6850 family outer membrane beta-barrel protein [Mangrovibacterium sp.]
MTTIFHKLFLLVAAFLVATMSHAQVFQTNYQTELSASAWLNSANPTGLSTFSSESKTLVELYSDKQQGDFVNYYESNNSLSLGARSESIVRLNPKLVLSGKLNYLNFSGKNMGGATFLNPYYNPFNVVEYTLDDAGTKKSESYSLEGGLSVALSEYWLVGGRIFYQTTGYFKTKDLRHTNDWLDLKTDLGIVRQLGRNSLGLSYHYRRTVESISYQVVGTTDKEYNLLIDYGLFFGKQERFGGTSGYTAGGSPMINDFHGIGLQFGTHFKSLELYNEIGINLRQGYYGTKASSTVLYTEHNGRELFYKGAFTLHKGKATHRLNVQFYQNKLSNKANSYREETASNGNTVVVYYGANQVLNRSTTQLLTEYRAELKKEGVKRWEIWANGNFINKDETATLYPEYRKQVLSLFSASLAIQRHFLKNKNQYSPYFQMQYGGGSGDKYKEGKYGSGESETKSVRLDDYLNREYEYLTSNRTSALLGFRYTRTLHSAQRLHFDLSYQLTKASKVEYIGDTTGLFSVRLGCEF